MKNQDVFKILLCSYGYDRNIKIEPYRADFGACGYDIYAENKDGDSYHEINCEGIMFNVFHILDYMKQNNAEFNSNWWNVPSMKYVLDDELRQSAVTSWDKQDKEIQEDIIRCKPITDWLTNNKPCTNCKINKHDHWDTIHHNCELCHNHSCELLLKFYADFEVFKSTLK
jgi:hypothetical protein